MARCGVKPTLLILSRHPEHVLRVYIDHYKRHRPHRALELHPAEPILAPFSSLGSFSNWAMR